MAAVSGWIATTVHFLATTMSRSSPHTLAEGLEELAQIVLRASTHFGNPRLCVKRHLPFESVSIVLKQGRGLVNQRHGAR